MLAQAEMANVFASFFSSAYRGDPFGALTCILDWVIWAARGPIHREPCGFLMPLDKVAGLANQPWKL